MGPRPLARRSGYGIILGWPSGPGNRTSSRLGQAVAEPPEQRQTGMYHQFPPRAKRHRIRRAAPVVLLILVLLAALACADLIQQGAGGDRPDGATPTWTPWTDSDSDPSSWSPLSTPTPAASPTPIVHVVQPDETLVSISLDYDVDSELLQRVNGIEDPSLLQVGRELLIPTGDEVISTPLPLLLPTPTPVAASVRGERCYQTPVGSVQCLGEIVNTSALTVTNAHVSVALVDSSGAPLLEADAQTAADVVPPGGRSPFRLLFTTPPEGWADLSATIARAEVAGLLPPGYVPIVVGATASEQVEAEYQISGSVQNSSPELVAESVTVIVTAYDADGYVIAVRQVDVDVGEALTPGAEAQFQILVAYHDGPPVQTSVVAQGRAPLGE
jgi:LysM repeat protein